MSMNALSSALDNLATTVTGRAEPHSISAKMLRAEAPRRSTTCGVNT